jgi:hypothetical protein
MKAGAGRVLCTRTCSRWMRKRPIDILPSSLRPGFSSQSIHGVDHVRGVKSVTSTTIIRRPAQGALPKKELETPVTEDEEPTYPTVIQQALNNMRKFSHCVLLTRVGSFYEVGSQKAGCNIKLTSLSCISIKQRNMHHIWDSN